MKTIFTFILVLLFSFNLSFSQEDNSVCGSTSFPWIDSMNTIPFYLRPGFGEIINFNVAVIFVDFPDGRVNGTDQVFDFNQLSQIVPNGGNLDAVAELGIDSLNGSWFYVPVKYTYADRWNMLFSTGYYYGNVHPDNHSHGSIGYGSLKEYFNEATTEHIRIIPALTHSEHSSDSILGYGIINRDTSINGRQYIKSIMLGKRKFGDNSFFGTTPGSLVNHNELKDSTISVLTRLHSSGEIEFNPTNFDGEILIVFAGGSGGVGGQAFYNSLTARGMYLHFKNDIADSNKQTRIDGIHILAHEMGHNPPFNFSHTNSGRYCLMNPNSSATHRDCPPHFNPAFKIMKGWANPTEYRHSQTITDLPPVEINSRIGIVTIYGKPSAVPDWQTGEYFIIENRRLLGFDRKINDYMGFANDTSFKGGVLIWHYSPYGAIHGNNCGDYGGVKLVLPYSDITNNCYNTASSYDFYGYNFDPLYHKLDSTRTYSSYNLRTGIIIDSITQQQTTTSDVSFKINYLIHEPPNYSYVICDYNNSINIFNLSDTVYYHNNQLNSAFHLSSGTVFESISNSIVINGIKAKGTNNNNIIFLGAGYDNYRILPNFLILSTNQIDDSLILSYCDFNNFNTNSIINCFCSSNLPVNINNINISDTSKHLKLIGGYTEQDNGNLSGFDNITLGNLDILNYWKFYIEHDLIIGNTTNFNIIDKGNNALTKIEFIYPYSIVCNGFFNLNSDLTINKNINISSSGKFKFYTSDNTDSVSLKFAPGTGLKCEGDFIAVGENSPMIEKLVIFDRNGESGNWNGINCYNSNSFYMDFSKVRNAYAGIQISHGTPDIDITNSIFSGNYYSDIYLDQMTLTDEAPGNITNNIFNDSITLLYGIGCSEVENLEINNSTFNSVYSEGIYLNHTSNIRIIGNKFYASLDPNASPVAGIHLYYSDGFLSCNEVTNFYDGFLINNSIPYLYNNEIYNNGLGIYITNDAIPVMAPCYSPTQTFNAGHNKIYNNINDEIFCDYTLPYLYQGKNSIYDSTGGCLISLQLYSQDTLLAQGNFWGDVPEAQMFCPSEYIDYSEYLEYPLNITSCSPYITYENNDSLSQDILLFGSANINEYLKNYSNATNEYMQIINTYNNNLLNHLVSSKIFFTNLKANINFSGISAYYNNLANQHSEDTLLYKRLLKMMIASHIEEPLYQQAINEYQNIINNSQNQSEIFYATIEKLRAIELMIDTLLNGGGDNPINNNYSVQELTYLVTNLLLQDYSSSVPLKINREENYKIVENKIEKIKTDISKENNNVNILKTEDVNSDAEVEKIIKKDESKKHIIIPKSSSGIIINKLNSINNLKKIIPIDKLNLNKINNFELLNLLDKVITVKLIEESLLNYTPDARPLLRMKKNNVRKTIRNEVFNNLPKEYKLYQNYPNPFNPITKIVYELPKDGNVKFAIYDILGREIKTLVNEFKQAGSYLIEFNGNNLASGIYFYVIQVAGGKDYTAVKKMVLTK